MFVLLRFTLLPRMADCAANVVKRQWLKTDLSWFGKVLGKNPLVVRILDEVHTPKASYKVLGLRPPRLGLHQQSDPWCTRDVQEQGQGSVKNPRCQARHQGYNQANSHKSKPSKQAQTLGQHFCFGLQHSHQCSSLEPKWKTYHSSPT